MGLNYDPSVDGELADYLLETKRKVIPACFIGFDWYEKLVERCYVIPFMSNIRLIFTDGIIEDQFYQIISISEAEGYQLDAHSGQPGVHSIEKLLSQPNVRWEISEWNYEKVKEDSTNPKNI